jgi:hypothetical protein
MRRFLVAINSVAILVSCASGDGSRQETIQAFEAAISADGSCEMLFDLLDALDPDDPYIESANGHLQRIGCLSRSADREEATSTTVPSTSDSSDQPYDVSAFNSFMEAAVSGTSYEFGARGTPSWDTSAKVMQWTAEAICGDLAAGRSESDLRTEMAENERLGDPALDRDIPTFIDAIFEAARTFICPSS